MSSVVERIHFKSPEEYKPGDILIPSDMVEERLDEMADEIADVYNQSHNLLIVGLMTGAVTVTVDLLRRLHNKENLTNVQVELMRVKSYSEGTSAQHEPKFEYDISTSPAGRNILIVDDIADTGKSLRVVHEVFNSRDAASVRSAVLVNKPGRREVHYVPDFVGFTIPNVWVQGRGMDTDGIGRGEDNIIVGPYFYDKAA